MEQNRNIRLKYENARSIQASVLKQQIYKFDNNSLANSIPPNFILEQPNASVILPAQNRNNASSVSNGYAPSVGGLGVGGVSNPNGFRNSNIMNFQIALTYEISADT